MPTEFDRRPAIDRRATCRTLEDAGLLGERVRHRAAGVESLQAHHTYLEGLGRDFDPAEFLQGMTIGAGHALGVRNAVAFGRVQLHGV